MKSAAYAGAAGALLGLTMLMLVIIALGAGHTSDLILAGVFLDAAVAFGIATFRAERRRIA